MESKNAKRIVKMRDVARAAGVSTMTVSRFISQHPHVTERTSKKVRRAIDQLGGYSPNLAARMLKGYSSGTLGLIIPNLRDSFYAGIADCVQEEAFNRGFHVWVATSNDDERMEADLVTKMRQHRVDGLLITPSPHSAGLRTEAGCGPIVMIGRPDRRGDSVLVDDRNSASHATQHLLTHGYKRILCVGMEDPSLHTTVERITGYEECMRSAGHKLEVFVGLKSQADIQAAIRSAMSSRRPPEAILSIDGNATLGTLESLAMLNLSVPGKVALISFGDHPLSAVLRPRLTVIREPAAGVGRFATRLLFEQLGASRKMEPVMSVVQGSLVVRESCGCEAGEHRLKIVPTRRRLQSGTPKGSG